MSEPANPTTKAEEESSGGSTSTRGESSPIMGSVARILNSRELVINRGSTHGVQPEMVFEVLAREGDDIEDPETGELLGSIARPKVAVKIVDVQPRLAVARTYRSRRRNVGGTGGVGAFTRYFEPPRYVTEYDTLKTSDKTWENLDPAESYVQAGDPVRQVLAERTEE